MRDEEQQRKERQAKLLSAIERKIAYKNIDFIIQHQNDTKDELAAYLKACMDDIGHAPAKVEIIGGDLIEYRFGSWAKALGKIYSGPLSTVKLHAAGAKVFCQIIKRIVLMLQHERDVLHGKCGKCALFDDAVQSVLQRFVRMLPSHHCTSF